MDAFETTIYHALIIACLVMGFLLFCFFITVIRQQRRNLELRRKNLFTEISGLEQERSRIATDLHDELSPLLCSIKLINSSFNLIHAEDRLNLQKSNEYLDNSVARIKSISHNLMPATLLKNGFISAISEHIDFLNIGSGIHFEFLPPVNCRIADSISIHVYRIVQEVILNITKHSKATDAIIEMINRKKSVRIIISDNGVGFDFKKELFARTGIGLSSISNRIKIIAGSMYVDSSPESGTTYVFDFPK